MEAQLPGKGADVDEASYFPGVKAEAPDPMATESIKQELMDTLPGTDEVLNAVSFFY